MASFRLCAKGVNRSYLLPGRTDYNVLCGECVVKAALEAILEGRADQSRLRSLQKSGRSVRNANSRSDGPLSTYLKRNELNTLKPAEEQFLKIWERRTQAGIFEDHFKVGGPDRRVRPRSHIPDAVPE